MKEDKIIKQWLKELPEEMPSDNFTSNIMDQIEPLQQKVYQPLISKKVWAFIVLAFAVLASLLALQEGYHHNLYLPEFTYPEINFGVLSHLLDFGTFTSPVISLSIAAVFLLWTLLMLSQSIKLQDLFNKKFII